MGEEEFPSSGEETAKPETKADTKETGAADDMKGMHAESEEGTQDPPMGGGAKVEENFRSSYFFMETFYFLIFVKRYG